MNFDLSFVLFSCYNFCFVTSEITENRLVENYDALTGETFRDKVYTWTSSVFLILANEFFARSRGKYND